MPSKPFRVLHALRFSFPVSPKKSVSMHESNSSTSQSFPNRNKTDYGYCLRPRKQNRRVPILPFPPFRPCERASPFDNWWNMMPISSIRLPLLCSFSFHIALILMVVTHKLMYQSLLSVLLSLPCFPHFGQTGTLFL